MVNVGDKVEITQSFSSMDSRLRIGYRGTVINTREENDNILYRVKFSTSDGIVKQSFYRTEIKVIEHKKIDETQLLVGEDNV